MLLRHFVAGMLMFSLVIATAAFWITDMRAQYPDVDFLGNKSAVFVNDSGSALASVYDKSANMTNIIKISKNSTLEAQEAEVTTGDIFVKGLVSVILLPLQSVNLATEIIASIAKYYDIPTYIIGIVVGLIIIAVMYAVVSLFMKRKT